MSEEWSGVYKQVGTPAKHQAWGLAWSQQVWSPAWSQLNRQVCSQVGDQLWIHLYRQAKGQLQEELEDE